MPLNCAIKQFNKGPKVAVYVISDRDRLIFSSLEIADSFQCRGADSEIISWLENYIEGRASPVSFISDSPFQNKILQALSHIPFGKVATYQNLAEICGCPKGARAAGNACGKNPLPLFIPCHRVIRSDGTLGGFAGDIEVKRRLLEFEKSLNAS